MCVVFTVVVVLVIESLLLAHLASTQVVVLVSGSPALLKSSQSQSFVCAVDFKFGGGRGTFTESKGPTVPRMEFI